ncbi:putative translation initiation factor IF-2 [Candidatus Zinderia insecticola CARI]|uniref:Translation initiation factor IF-2 n=1 Tax=Zinderia insecticola (strain CARI) TaxID=871271 RepID=E0TIR9_ZINIC|nr:putative translation initiation factor IF-2 [Candidatus Zinderia insecticola CARI]
MKIKFKRPPIIGIMGHVNHGKTSLLDYIIKTNIVSKEIGNITQNINVYNIETLIGPLTFIDTPGHEAFSHMRILGVKIIDIMLLVIAADDGVMPQTKEVISYILNNKIPLIVVINKIDKLNINIKKIINQLNNLGIISDKYGGESLFVNFSSKTGEGYEQLINNIKLLTDILDIKFEKNKNSKGIIIESILNKKKGPLVIVLSKCGILKKGNFMITKSSYGKVKSILNENFKNIDFLYPSIPGIIQGLNILPKSGEKFFITSNKKKIKKKKYFISKKKINKNNKLIFKKNKSSKNYEGKKLNLILKSYNYGNQKSILNILTKFYNKYGKIKIINYSIGDININDIILCKNTNSIIIAFNLYENKELLNFKKKYNIKIYYFYIIYDILKKLKKIMYLKKKRNEKKIKVLGYAEIKKKIKKECEIIAGCYITKGKIKKNSFILIKRNDIIIWKGYINSIKHYGKEIKEAKYGIECGITFKNFNSFYINDKLEIFDKKENIENIESIKNNENI